MALLLAGALTALVISFLCSIMEATLLSLTPGQLAELSATRPRTGALWRGFKANVERPIAAILILNTTAHTIGASVAGAQWDKLFEGRYILLFSLGFTFLMLQFTEILPKTLGVRFNTEAARLFGGPLSALSRLLTPVIHIVHGLNRPFERKRAAPKSPATLTEISVLAGLARLSRLIGAHEERIIRGAAQLSRTPVRDVMIPLDQITFLSTSQGLMDAIIAAHMDPHTRFPICEGGDPDRVVGYVNFKEMIYFMRTNPGDPSLRGIIRPVRFVAPEESAGVLLSAFVDEHVHIAIVRSAEGRTLGLVTLEDIVEQLVGALDDEFDRPPRMVHALSGGTWMVGGGASMPELAATIQASLPDAQGTLSEWLIRRMARLPKVGEVYQEAGIEFAVRRLRRRKVFEVSVSRIGGPHPGMVPSPR